MLQAIGGPFDGKKIESTPCSPQIYFPLDAVSIDHAGGRPQMTLEAMRDCRSQASKRVTRWAVYIREEHSEQDGFQYAGNATGDDLLVIGELDTIEVAAWFRDRTRG